MVKGVLLPTKRTTFEGQKDYIFISIVFCVLFLFVVL